jgi:hypothetical protein
MERLIDSLAEGVIDKDQFTSRMNRTKTLSDVDAKIGAQATDADGQARVRSLMRRLADFSSRVQSQLPDYCLSESSFSPPWPHGRNL